MKQLYLLIILLILIGCGATKRINFQTDTFMSNGLKENFEISVPSDYVKATSNLEIYILKKWIYEKNGLLYISLDISFADSPNIQNWMKCSDASTAKKCTEGVDDDGKYWKELLIDNLVVGYKDVPMERKNEFDNAILSMKKVE